MSKTWIGSDLHFGHANIMKFCPETRARFKNDVAYMNEAMVREWNEIVQPEDLTYILGDVAFCNVQTATGFLRRMNGRKVLIEGNHDKKLVQDASFCAEFESVHKYLDVNYDGHKIVMFHYPIFEWDQAHRGAIHFYGHKHGGACPDMTKYRARDVGMDATGRIVVSMEDAIRDALTGAIKGHHD
jgi:calcineurin-like phosphoesterase family protein